MTIKNHRGRKVFVHVNRYFQLKYMNNALNLINAILMSLLEAVLKNKNI